jgi:CRISPR-associated protein dxTHG motif protein
LIEGEVGITFELVNWAKEKGIIAIYGVEKVTDNFLLKVEFYEY